MSIIKLYAEDYDPGVTLISNAFIDYFLKDANDAQLKVYLYLVRHISNHKPFDISNIADEYNHTETDVIRSLKYWEQKQLISLEYDARNNLTGIELHTIDEDMINPREPIHMFAVPSSDKDNENTENAGFKETKFSASDFVELSKDSDWVSVRSIAECYLSRTLSANDLQILAHIYKDLEFQPCDVDRLMEKCLTDGKKTMRLIKKAAEEEYTANITNPAINAVMNALGRNGAPSPAELSYIDKWLSVMSLEMVLEGCRKASLAVSASQRFKYANGIFQNWETKGIKTIEDIAKDDENHRQSKETAPKKQAAACKASTSSTYKKVTQYETDYDFEELERQYGLR